MKMKKFDCVKMKHLGAEKVLEKTKGMTREQELKFWHECSTELIKRQLLIRKGKQVQPTN